MNQDCRLMSLHQPWASLVALGLKEWETRSFKYRTTASAAILATKTQPVCINAELDRIWNESGKDKRLEIIFDARPLPQGGIIAFSATMTCYRMWNRFPETEGQSRTHDRGLWEVMMPAMSPLEIACGDWKEGRFAYRLINVRQVPFLPYRGKQGFPKLPIEVVQQLCSEVKS